MPASTPSPTRRGGAPSQARALRAQGRRTMGKLLQAGMRVFDDRGYQAARVDDVVRVARTSHGTFYLYFANKEDLFRVLAEDCTQAMTSLAGQLGPISDDEAGYADLRTWLADFVATYRRHGPVIRAWAEAQVDNRQLARLGGTSMDRVTARIAERMAEARGTGDVDHRQAAVALLAMLERFNHYLLSRRIEADDDVLDTLARIAHRGMFAGASSRAASPSEAFGATGPARALTRLPAAVPSRVTPRRRRRPPPEQRQLRDQGRKTKRRLLDASIAVLESRGYHAARVDDIVDAANTSHGTFYLYFSNKEDLFAALLAEVSDEVTALAESLGPVGPDRAGHEELRGWLARFADLYAHYGPVFQAWTEAEQRDRAVGSRRPDVLAGVVRAVAHRLAEQGWGASADTAALAVTAMVERFGYYVLAGRVRVERQQLVDTLARVVHVGAFGGTAGRDGPGRYPS